MKKRSFVGLFLVSLTLTLLPGCEWHDTSFRRTFFHGRFHFEVCADVGDQDISAHVFYSEFDPIDICTNHFDVSFDKSFLDLNVYIDEGGHAYGLGEIQISFADGDVWKHEKSFNYFGVMNGTSGGDIFTDLGEYVTNFVFSIYWFRFSAYCELPGAGTRKLMFGFTTIKAEYHPYPEEFEGCLLGKTC